MVVQTPSPPSVVALIEELTAARLRGDKPEKLLELSEAAIDQATAASDLESIAAELDSAAAAYPEQGDGLRLRFAAERAHAIASRAPAIAAVQDAPEQVRVAERVFRLTGLVLGVIVVLGVFSVAAILLASELIAVFVLVVGTLALLYAAVTGAAGFQRWFHGKRSDD